MKRIALRRTAMPQRKKRLRSKGGRMFKQTPEDVKYWDYLWDVTHASRLYCDGCGRIAWLSRCHLLARSQGGRDLWNVSLLCEDEPGVYGCHARSEKNVARFCEETGRDLYAKALRRTDAWRYGVQFELDADLWEAS